jgi:multidrug efflux pump subunit AcrB
MKRFRFYGLIGLFARHPVAANLLMLIMLMAGAVALHKLNVQFFPNFALEMVQVRVVWPGANAEDVERSITVPIEQALRNEDGLDQMTSTSSAGASLVVLRYKDGVDIVEALDRVRQKVTSLRNLPQDIEKPVISRFIRYERVAKVTLVSETGDMLALRQWVRDFEKELLRRGIDKVDFIGLPPLQLKVDIPLETQRRSERTLAGTDFDQPIAFTRPDGTDNP